MLLKQPVEGHLLVLMELPLIPYFFLHIEIMLYSMNLRNDWNNHEIIFTRINFYLLVVDSIHARKELLLLNFLLLQSQMAGLQHHVFGNIGLIRVVRDLLPYRLHVFIVFLELQIFFPLDFADLFIQLE